MTDAIKEMMKTAENFDKRNDKTMHRVRLEVFSDGSGEFAVIDTATNKAVYVREFESPSEIQFGNLRSGLADGIAAILESESTPMPVSQFLTQHVADVVKQSDISHPDTIRRVYPIVSDILTKSKKHRRNFGKGNRFD